MLTIQKVALGAFIFMGLGLSVAPVLAQTPGNGLLNVYVQVINNYGGSTRNPSDFSVLVTGNNPSPATFVGSQNGVQVSLGAGTYNVTLTNSQSGYTPTFSQGCNGTIAAGQNSLCVITMATTNSYNSYPTPFPNPYNYPALHCVPQNQTVGLRQNVRFEAVGGAGGTYNWSTPERNYPNSGPVLTISFDGSGSKLVTVTNANQTATCVVEVTNSYNPGTVYPTYPTYPTTPGYYPAPRLPNTGFEPMTSAQLALALALLAGVAAVSLPYARKAFAIVTK